MQKDLPDMRITKKLMENVYNSYSAVASIGLQNNIIVAAHNIF